MVTDLVRRSVGAIDPEQKFQISFVNDRSAHLTVLLPDGAFDVGFPWYKPDCSKAGKLGEDMQALCTGFEFSNAILEVPVGYYVRADDPLTSATGHSALFGKRLCRPEGHFTFDLDQSDLTAEHVSIAAPSTAETCFSKLARGQVDVVTLAKHKARELIHRLASSGEVAEIQGLASIQTLHASAPASNPNRLAHLDLVNRGLAALMASGRWFEVVSFHHGNKLALSD